MKPRVGLVLGDGGGIGAELAAKLLALPEIAAAADIAVIGDARLLALGAMEAGVTPRIDAVVNRLDGPLSGIVMLDRGDADPSAIRIGEISVEGARPALDNYRTALDLVRAGRVDAITFVPFNKQAMRLVDAGFLVIVEGVLHAFPVEPGARLGHRVAVLDSVDRDGQGSSSGIAQVVLPG